MISEHETEKYGENTSQAKNFNLKYKILKFLVFGIANQVGGKLPIKILLKRYPTIIRKILREIISANKNSDITFFAKNSRKKVLNTIRFSAERRPSVHPSLHVNK